MQLREKVAEGTTIPELQGGFPTMQFGDKSSVSAKFQTLQPRTDHQPGGPLLNSAAIPQCRNISDCRPLKSGPLPCNPARLSQLCDEISLHLIEPPISFIPSDNNSWKRPK